MAVAINLISHIERIDKNIQRFLHLGFDFIEVATVVMRGSIVNDSANFC